MIEEVRFVVALPLKIEQLKFFSSVKEYFINACEYVLCKVLTNNSNVMIHEQVANLRKITEITSASIVLCV
jgi:hypothetical protein